jgi:predicted flap endonuclease-1-like 5' DNA nuclease
MSSLGCFLWWLVLGGLLGWLASWLFGKRKPEVIEKIVDRPVDRIVEKIVDRPVDRIVEKVVEKTVDRPVDRIVEKLVDNPVHLSKIAALSAEVAGIAGLKMTIDQMRAAPPKTVEKIVEKIVDRPVEKIVEKIVDRPVEKIVEKIVDRPVDRIVEKMVDNPSHLAKIATLTAEVAGIAALKMTIDQLRSAPPKTVEKIVEKIVDRPVEKIVEKIVDRPVEKIVEKIVDRPVDRVVEKIVEKIVDRPVDRIVEKLVDNPAQTAKIATLAAEVATIAGLKMTIDQLRNAPPKTVEKIVEKIVDRPVDRIVEKIVDRPVEKIVEKIVDRPVDRVVEKIVEKIVDRPVDRIVEKLVDNPAQTAKIATLTAEVATIAGLKMTIDQLRNAPPKTVEKIVEKVVDRPVDRIVEKVVEKQIDNPVHLTRIKTLEAELALLRRRSAKLDTVAAKAAGFTVRGMDDLEIIEGIGPKIAGLFHEAGIYMFWELEETPITKMQEILDAAGPNYRLANPASWAKQSGLAADNKWSELRKLQDELIAGVKK